MYEVKSCPPTDAEQSGLIAWPLPTDIAINMTLDLSEVKDHRISHSAFFDDRYNHNLCQQKYNTPIWLQKDFRINS